ncbi:MAG: hypothetical protein COB65_01510 [Thalassobium sp.]|nr:MAG: hypothetical protein COB65_01510 [Thalassobium sp.]
MKLKTTYYQELLKGFDTHVVATKSIRSGNYYTGQVYEFLGFLENNRILDVRRIERKHTNKYYDLLCTRQKHRGKGFLSQGSINGVLSTLRMFSIWLQKTNVLSSSFDIPANSKIEKQGNNLFALKREICTTDQIKLIYNACNSNCERSIIAIAYGSGLRRLGLVQLEESDVNFVAGNLVVIESKNNKTRHVPISDFFLNVLKEYSLERLRILSKHKRKSKAFFIDTVGQPITGEMLNTTLKRIISRTKDQALIKKQITLHCLRHSIATHLIDDGQTFEYVQSFLGHSQVDTTTIYARKRKIKNYYTI